MSKAGAVLEEVKKAVVGKDEVLVQGLLAILAGGHILLENIPGVGKTAMALAFSRALALEYNRVQFTPDVLPRPSRAFPSRAGRARAAHGGRADGLAPHLCRALCGRHGPQHHDASACGGRHRPVLSAHVSGRGAVCGV